MELVKTLKPSFTFANFTIRVNTFMSIGIIVIVDANLFKLVGR